MLRIPGAPTYLASCGKNFFLSNAVHAQSRPLVSSLFGPKMMLGQLNRLVGMTNRKPPSTRFFSNTGMLKSRWKNVLKGPDPTSRYDSLHRFQQYQNNSGNTIGKLTIVGVSVMAGIFVLSPYLFQYCPPFTHFSRNPTHLVYAILGINTAVLCLWKVPRCWRYLQRYMLLEKDHIYSKWALIGSAFSHQELWHLGMNMLALWSFGTSLATLLGGANFFSLYMNSAIAGSLFSIWYPRIARIAMMSPSLGASGALFGVFGCFSYLFPHAKILLFVFPIPGGAWVAFLGAAAWNAAGCVFRWGSFDYAAHLGGSVMGILYGYLISEVAKKQREKSLQSLTRWF